jgi:hypothetical protein
MTAPALMPPPRPASASASALMITVNFCHLAPLFDRDHGGG